MTSASPPFNILYVDDEAENLLIFKAVFKKEFNILTAQSAKEGLDIINNHAVHLLISDQRMPYMTGIEFLEQVRNHKPDCIRIIMTGYTDYESIVNAINKAGIYYFIKKPWTKEEIQVLLDKAISYYTLQKRNRQLVTDLWGALNDLELFLYRSFHDLKGPVTTQLGILNILKQEDNYENMPSYIKMLEEATKKLNEAIIKFQKLKNILDKEQFSEVPVNFSEITHEIVFANKLELHTKKIAVDLTIDENIHFYSGPLLIKLLLEPLFENSLEFYNEQEQNPFIRLSIFQKNSEIVIEVVDNGIGIPKEYLDKIFDPFFRGSIHSGGNGLGLYLVKRAVDRLEGLISVESEEGIGSKFTITLPLERKHHLERLPV
jgi:signal transduction histidine kinase